MKIFPETLELLQGKTPEDDIDNDFLNMQITQEIRGKSHK
jgi:hypothetical protein